MINILLNDKEYITDDYRNNVLVFCLDTIEMNNIINKKQHYLNELLLLEGEDGENCFSNKKTILVSNGYYTDVFDNNIKKNFYYFFVILFLTFIIFCILIGDLLSCFVWLMSLVIFIPKTRQLILSKNPNFKIIITICRILLPCLGLLFVGIFIHNL